VVVDGVFVLIVVDLRWWRI